MPHFRHVIAKELPIDHFSLAVDETRAAFRLLAPTDGFDIAPDAEYVPIEKLSTTEELGSRYCKMKHSELYQINDQDYVILAEIIIDKTKPEFQRVWVPGAHFVTWFDGRVFRCDLKGGLTYFDFRNTAEYCRYMGGMWLFDLWVRNPAAPVTECARSITTTADATIITNVDDLGDVWTADDVMTGTTSKWLNLAYELTPSSETVAPDGWVDFTLTLKDGKTHEVASDITWDGYIVEPVGGYAPHKRLAVTNGVGRFRAQALGLQDGESMRMKINHRFFTSRAEAVVRVSADG